MHGVSAIIETKWYKKSRYTQDTRNYGWFMIPEFLSKILYYNMVK